MNNQIYSFKEHALLGVCDCCSQLKLLVARKYFSFYLCEECLIKFQRKFEK